MTPQEELDAKIVEQGNLVRSLKSQNPVDKDAIAEQVALLKQLKAEKDANSPSTVPKSASDEKEGKADSKKGKGGGYTLKVPKGTKDYTPQEMAVRKHIFSTITKVFKKHGAVTIDTPVFELREILAGKYGEDSKLIYDLEDQGGEICSLRYDLTVPFARFLAMNPSTYQNIKRYHIAKVYRRDQPAMTKGRMREFYQCDFDIAGTYDPMVPDSEALRILVEVLDNLDVGKYTIKVNHRKILDGIFAICGVPTDNFRPISSAVDKLDKLPWTDVRKEMIDEKGLDPVAADKIGEYVKLKGGKELCDALLQDAKFVENESANAGVEDMKLLFKYLQIFNVADKVSFDLSLARGLDYYTGIIYEAVLEQSTATENSGRPKDAKESEEANIPIGSIAAGGRYDDLVGMFTSTSKKSGSKVPCVGISIGVERVFSILWKRAREQEDKLRSNETQVLVVAVGDGLLEERMKICVELWENNINAEFMYKVKPKLQNQFNACDRDRIPFAVIIGKDEVESGIVKIKSMAVKIEEEGPGVPVKRTDMISELRKRIANLVD